MERILDRLENEALNGNIVIDWLLRKLNLKRQRVVVRNK